MLLYHYNNNKGLPAREFFVCVVRSIINIQSSTLLYLFPLTTLVLMHDILQSEGVTIFIKIIFTKISISRIFFCDSFKIFFQ